MRHGLRGRMLSWIHNFLQDRLGAVQIAGLRSKTRPYEYGLPQGSCLSPILFNVLLSDLFAHNFISVQRDIGVFADDIRLACYEPSVTRASRLLTETLNSVQTFANKWRLSFDLKSKKCGSMTFSLARQRQQETVFFGRTRLSQLQQYKHLGVVFDSRLSFRPHVQRIRRLAWGAYHRIRKYTSRFWGASLDIMILLYRACVQPVLRYACPVWSLASKAVLNALTPIHTETPSTCTAECGLPRCEENTYVPACFSE